MDDAEKQDTIEAVTARIIARHPDASRTLVARVVAEEYDQLASGRIRTYIPTLIEQGLEQNQSGVRSPARRRTLKSSREYWRLAPAHTTAPLPYAAILKNEGFRENIESRIPRSMAL